VHVGEHADERSSVRHTVGILASADRRPAFGGVGHPELGARDSVVDAFSRT
jgi:hypothetical protein